jgi:hypothetical protein
VALKAMLQAILLLVALMGAIAAAGALFVLTLKLAELLRL